MSAWTVDALLASALLMGVVLLLRSTVRRLFGPGVAYALWALPALRLLLPPMPDAWREQAAMPITRAGEVVTVLITPAATPVQAVAEPAHWAAILVVTWALGALTFFALHLARHCRFCGQLLRDARTVDEVDGVRVIESAAATGPLAFGVARRFVAFPRDFADRYDAEERALALAHELGHHARRDLLANWAALAVLALHWFNPLAWRAFRAFRCDQELANDARVLAGRGRADRHAYACAIVKAAHGGAVSVACHLHTIDDLKGRIRMLKFGPVSPNRLRAGAAAIAVIAAAGLGLTASGTTAASAVTASVGDTIGIDLHEDLTIDLAQLATPPAPAVPPAPGTMPAPTAPPIAPETPSVAELGPVPPVPPMPLVPAVRGDREVTMIRNRDGRPVGLASIPEVREARCGGSDQPLVRHEEHNGRRRMTICTDRIERMAERGAEIAANSKDIERNALRSALSGLTAARSAIESNPDLTADQRRQALDGLDEGKREIERDLAKVD